MANQTHVAESVDIAELEKDYAQICDVLGKKDICEASYVVAKSNLENIARFEIVVAENKRTAESNFISGETKKAFVLRKSQLTGLILKCENSLSIIQIQKRISEQNEKLRKLKSLIEKYYSENHFKIKNDFQKLVKVCKKNKNLRENQKRKFLIIEFLNKLTKIKHNKNLLAKVKTASIKHAKNTITLNELSRNIKFIDESLCKINLHSAALTNLKLQNGKDIERIMFLEIYVKCIDKKGIPRMVLEKLCEILNRECNIILNDICDFELDIRYDPKNNLRIYTTEGQVRIPASMSSGYQKFIMDMIMRIVLTSVLGNNKSCNLSNPNMLIIDEGFGCLDKKNFIEVAKVMKQLKANFQYIIVITHLTELKSYANDIISISRDKGYSRIEHGEKVNIAEIQNVKLRQIILDKQDELNVVRAKTNKRQLEKKAIHNAKKKAVLNEKERKRKTKERLTGIMNSIPQRRHYLIELDNPDKPTTFKCKGCDKQFKFTEVKLTRHVNGTSYAGKHRKYIKSVLQSE